MKKKEFYLGLFIGLTLGATLVLFIPLEPRQHTGSSLAQVDGAQADFSSAYTDADSAAIISSPVNKTDIAAGTSETPVEISQPLSYSPEECEEACSRELLDKFLAGEILTAEEIHTMTLNSHQVAVAVGRDAGLQNSLRASVLKGLEDDTRFAILRVIYHLPADQAMSFVDQLNDGPEKDRVNAVKLLTMLSSGRGVFAQKIENLIQTETNPRVLSAGIDALNAIAPDEISDTTLHTVSALLVNNDDPAVKGKALEALTQLQYYDESVEQYLQEGLDSPSPELQLSSMFSLENLSTAKKQTGGHQGSQISPSMQKRIVEIANNPNLPADVRMQALSLMKIYM